MFGGKKKDQIKKSVSVDKADIKAFLGPGSRFEGKLNFDEMVRLDGVFSGEITSSDTLVVGETAEIDGSINVGALILSGRFKGGIKAHTLVDLRAPAQVEGTIEAASIKIAENVVFNGEIRMTTPENTVSNMKTTEEKKQTGKQKKN